VNDRDLRIGPAQRDRPAAMVSLHLAWAVWTDVAAGGVTVGLGAVGVTGALPAAPVCMPWRRHRPSPSRRARLQASTWPALPAAPTRTAPEPPQADLARTCSLR
jgi:hypothetical protein